jgi:AICAR transformylase/IMP cyclohydrolase PurH
MQLQEEIKQTLKNRDNFIEEVEKYDKLIEEEIEEKKKQLNEQMLNGSKLRYGNEELLSPHSNSPMKTGNSQYNQSKKWSNHHNGNSGHSNGQD